MSIQKTVRKNKSQLSHVYYNAKIGLTSTNNVAVLELLKENFGGSVYSYKPDNPKHRPWSVWQTSDKHARDILVVLQPYFMAKKRHAEIIIDFVNICDAQWQLIKRTQKAPYHITAEMTRVEGALLGAGRHAQLDQEGRRHRCRLREIPDGRARKSSPRGLRAGACADLLHAGRHGIYIIARLFTALIIDGFACVCGLLIV